MCCNATANAARATIITIIVQLNVLAAQAQQVRHAAQAAEHINAELAVLLTFSLQAPTACLVRLAVSVT